MNKLQTVPKNRIRLHGIAEDLENFTTALNLIFNVWLILFNVIMWSNKLRKIFIIRVNYAKVVWIWWWRYLKYVLKRAIITERVLEFLFLFSLSRSYRNTNKLLNIQLFKSNLGNIIFRQLFVGQPKGQASLDWADCLHAVM